MLFVKMYMTVYSALFRKVFMNLSKSLEFRQKVVYNLFNNLSKENTTMLFLLDEAAANTPAANTTGSTIYTFVMLAVLFVVFYFIMYRPQKKQEKETANMRNNLQVGDEITTIGGIIGKIISIKEETVLLETSADRTKIRILKSAVRCVDVKAEDAQ